MDKRPTPSPATGGGNSNVQSADEGWKNYPNNDGINPGIPNGDGITADPSWKPGI